MRWTVVASGLVSVLILVLSVALFLQPSTRTTYQSVFLVVPIAVCLGLPLVDRPFVLPLSPAKMSRRKADELLLALRHGPLPKHAFLRLVGWATAVLSRRPSLVHVSTPLPVTVVGDVHGHFDDLFQVLADATDGRVVVFNGDYVDRGPKGVEVLTAIMGFLCAAPHAFYLARGNHEDPDLHLLYGFRKELLRKYDDEVDRALAGFFLALPFAHVVNNAVFVVHGGLPAAPVSLDDVASLPRTDPFLGDAGVPGLAAALLWSDPRDDPGASASVRGCGVFFGPDITARFLCANGLSLLVRSHEVKQKGYEWCHDGKTLTVFSASHYNGSNTAAVATITFEDGKPHVEVTPLKSSPLDVFFDIPILFLVGLFFVILLVLCDLCFIFLE